MRGKSLLLANVATLTGPTPNRLTKLVMVIPGRNPRFAARKSRSLTQRPASQSSSRFRMIALPATTKTPSTCPRLLSKRLVLSHRAKSEVRSYHFALFLRIFINNYINSQLNGPSSPPIECRLTLELFFFALHCMLSVSISSPFSFDS